jgi:hypothetical protein
LQKSIKNARPIVSLFHSFIFYAFSFYLLVNVNDVLEAYVDGWTTLGSDHILANLFNLFADIFSVPGIGWDGFLFCTGGLFKNPKLWNSMQM